MEENIKGQIDYLWRTHEHISEYVRFADAKAGITIVFVSSLIAACHGARLTVRLFSGSWGVRQALLATSLAAMIASIFCAVWVILPRLWTRNRSGFIFWGAILGHRSSETYAAEISKLNEENMREHLARQVYEISEVCAWKYKFVMYSLWFAAPGCVTAAILLVIG